MTLGVLVALLPVLGFPHAWESFFQVAAGVSIVTLIMWASIDKRLSHKAKAQKRQAHKMREAELGISPQNENQVSPPTEGI